MREKKLENEESDLFEYARGKGRLTDDEKAFVIAEHLEVLKGGLKPENKWILGHPDNLARVLSALTLEERLEGMKPEEIISGLTETQLEELLRLVQQRRKEAEQDKAQE